MKPKTMGVKRDHEGAEVQKNFEVEEDSSKITEDEAALYDRQIRLWGIECQKRLREAKLLVVGLNGVGVEVVKNLTLSGVASITILDDMEVSEADTSAQFFVATAEHGRKRAEASQVAIQELNPNVKVLIESGNPADKELEFFKNYTAIFSTGCNLDLHSRINRFCRDLNIQFYCADTFGFFGFGFLDLGKQHEFLSSKPDSKSAAPQTQIAKTMTKEILDYYPFGPTLLAKVGEGLRKRVNKVFVLLHLVNHFREAKQRLPKPSQYELDLPLLISLKSTVCTNLGVDESKISEDMLESLFGELSPVCSAVGGVMAQEIIKGVSKRGTPIHNYFLFDGIESTGVNETVNPCLKDGAE